MLKRWLLFENQQRLSWIIYVSMSFVMLPVHQTKGLPSVLHCRWVFHILQNIKMSAHVSQAAPLWVSCGLGGDCAAGDAWGSTQSSQVINHNRCVYGCSSGETMLRKEHGDGKEHFRHSERNSDSRESAAREHSTEPFPPRESQLGPLTEPIIGIAFRVTEHLISLFSTYNKIDYS